MADAFDFAPAADAGRLFDLRIALDPLRAFLRATAGEGPGLAARADRRRAVGEAFRDVFGASVEALSRVLLDRRRGAVRASLVGLADAAAPAARVRFLVGLGAALGPLSVRRTTRSCVDEAVLEHRDLPPDSLLRSPYDDDPFHNDGNEPGEPFDDFVALLVAERAHCAGGATRLLHLDDWAEADTFTRSPFARLPLRYVVSRAGTRVPRHVALDPAEEPGLRVGYNALFYDTPGGVCSRLSPGHAHPPDDGQWEYVRAVVRALVRPRNVAEFTLGEGELVVLNNTFWLHGRTALARDPGLRRRLLRVKGRVELAHPTDC